MPGSSGCQNLGHSPWHSPGPTGYVLPRLRACPPCTGGCWIRGPLAQGCGWNVVPGVRVLWGARPTPHSRLGRAGCLSLGSNPGPGFRKWPYATVCPCLLVPPGERACYFSAGEQMSQDCDPFAHPGPRISTSHNGGKTPGSQCCQEKETELRANGRETE